MKFFVQATLLAVSVVTATTVFAERADRNKPTQMEADRALYDDLKQVSIWEGNAILTRGSLIIRGQRVEVRQDPEGFQFGSSFGSTDKPAFFRQKRDGGEQYIEGFGERIDYDSKLDKVILTGRATMKRLDGTAVVDEVQGEVIEMDNRTDTYTVNTASPGKNTANAAAPAGRVRATLAPRGQAAPSTLGAPSTSDAPLPLKSSAEVVNPPRLTPAMPATPEVHKP